MKVSKYKKIASVGDRVRFKDKYDGEYVTIEGEVGEIQGDKFYVWQNECNGSVGHISPKGCKYSWVVYFNDDNVLLRRLRRRSRDTDKV